MRVSSSSLGGGEFGEHHSLVENLDRFVHGGQFEHGGFREVEAFGCFPFVVLLDQDRSGKTQQGCRVGEHADDVGATFDLLVDPFQRVRRPYLPPLPGCTGVTSCSSRCGTKPVEGTTVPLASRCKSRVREVDPGSEKVVPASPANYGS